MHVCDVHVNLKGSVGRVVGFTFPSSPSVNFNDLMFEAVVVLRKGAAQTFPSFLLL